MDNGKNTLRAAIYARFSSELQREESIDAQIRACKYYAQKEGLTIVKTYADKAKSGMSTKGRTAFLEMISDSKEGLFHVVIVHKLNRFGRDGLDTLKYKKILEENGVELISVTERLDNSPEGKLMLMVITGMNEFYSANLGQEVMKGLKENAYSGRHTGGIPPLGFDVDPQSKRLVINPREAEAVKIIFKMSLAGAGYSEIIRYLNANGYKTKRGQAFSKGSIHEILCNEKYTGTYVYNRIESPSNGKMNRHRYKSDSEIIRVKGVVPQIISEDDFAKMAEIMKKRRHKAASYTAKETYLLSGKIICGECGSHYTGISRKASYHRPQYVSYRCSKKHGKIQCNNPEIRREVIEEFVLRKLADYIFTDAMLKRLLGEYKAYITRLDSQALEKEKNIKREIGSVEKQMNNIVNVIAKTASSVLLDRLQELEQEKTLLEQQLQEQKIQQNSVETTEKDIKRAFRQAKRLFKKGTLSTNQQLIDYFVDKIIIYKNYIEIYFNISDIKTKGSAHGGTLFFDLLTYKESRDKL